MAIHADFDKRVAVHYDTLAWRASPMAGVDRKMLDRIGDEVARATTIVRYAPGSHFSPHVHSGGEEFLVLDGVFQDEHGDYPAGTYVRNPIGTKHTPRSEGGCTIFVKLWQFEKVDQKQFSVAANWTEKEQALHKFGAENVVFKSLEPNEALAVDADGGAEILVLDGSFEEAGECFLLHDWLRLPDGYQSKLTAGPRGVQLWVKTGHLTSVKTPVIS